MVSSHHDHEHSDSDFIDRRKRLGRATITNIGLFVFSTVLSFATKNTAFFAEALHDAGDSMVHGTRYGVEAKGIDQNTKRLRLMRRAGFFVSGVLSSVVAVRSGVDLLHTCQEVSSGNTQELIQFAGAVVIAGGNYGVYKDLDAIENHSFVSGDSHDHAKVDLVASVGLASCIAVDALGVQGASEFGGTVFASYTSYEMFKHGVTLNGNHQH